MAFVLIYFFNLTELVHFLTEEICISISTDYFRQSSSEKQGQVYDLHIHHTFVDILPVRLDPPDVNRRSFAANYTNFRSDPIRISLRGFNLPRRRLRSIPLMTDRLTGWLINQPTAVNAMEEDYWCKSHLVDTGKPQNHHLPHGRSVSQFSVVIRGK